MNILLVGSGGREHALAWKLSQSSTVDQLYIAKGNPGTAQYGQNVPVAEDDIPALLEFAKEKNIDLVVPGPELPLVLGIADAFVKEGIPCFGPDEYAAQLEGSKVFSKEMMAKTGVPTAAFASFTSLEEAQAYVKAKNVPFVVKASGLAAGKGVVVAQTVQETLDALAMIMQDKAFGASGDTVVVEEVLIGEEVSFLCLCVGEHVFPFPSAQDHKAVFNNDMGANTGGMGAYSPAPALRESEYRAMAQQVITPILKELIAQGHPFCGILYAGLMMTAQGPKVLEYNVRFGDPECQPLLMRFDGDLAQVLLAAATGRISDINFALHEGAALGVVLAAEGYPDVYKTNLPITGIAAAEACASAATEVKVFQAGTQLDGKTLVSKGGRVLCVTARAATLAQAQQLAYEAVGKIHMPNAHFRTDIGNKGLKAR